MVRWGEACRDARSSVYINTDLDSCFVLSCLVFRIGIGRGRNDGLTVIPMLL
jgi:hypothetical protein